jgi:hypothetical protein
MNAAAAKIQMLKSSMQCFAFGLLGLLPVIGLPFAIAALPDLGCGLCRRRNDSVELHPDHRPLSGDIQLRRFLILPAAFHAFGSFSSTISHSTW